MKGIKKRKEERTKEMKGIKKRIKKRIKNKRNERKKEKKRRKNKRKEKKKNLTWKVQWHSRHVSSVPTYQLQVNSYHDRYTC